MGDAEPEPEQTQQRWRVCRLCQTASLRTSGQWLRACRCRQPLHRQCLRYRVLQCEERRPSQNPSCPWCGDFYRVVPAKGPVISALDTFAHRWYPSVCQFTALVFAHQVAVDSASATFGLLILSSIYGSSEARAMVLDMDPLFAITLCHALPLAAIIINHVPWEDHFLETLRRCSRLPLVGPVMPQGGSSLRPVRHRSVTSFGALVGGLMLPSFAQFTGHLLFRSEESLVKRFLLGGAFFLVVRGILYMYYQQKSFVRQNSLSVADFVPRDRH